MNALAWVVIACWAFMLLPGSSLKRKVELGDIDWASPHPYVNFARSFAALALAIWVIA